MQVLISLLLLSCSSFHHEVSAKYLAKWRAFGPFPVGKTEFDGDPVQSLGGIDAILSNRTLKVVSELSGNGYVGWSTFSADEQGFVSAYFSHVPYNTIVQALNSITALETQAWFTTSAKINTAGRYLVRCEGVHNYYFRRQGDADHRFYHGDIYTRDLVGQPFDLIPGTYNLHLRLRAKAQGRFRCSIAKANKLFIASPTTVVPDIFAGRLASSVVAIDIRSYHTALLDVKLQGSVSLTNINTNTATCRVYPGQLKRCFLKLTAVDPTDVVMQEREQDKCAKLSIAITADQSMENVDVWIRCRHRRQSFQVSYLDHDSAPVMAAVIAPWDDTCAQPGCGVLLSLSGVGVTPNNQADAHKYKIKQSQKDYLFGFKDKWIVCPERAGAHNWEGVGFQNAAYAVKAVADVISQAFPALPLNQDNVVLSGHSRGGHGSLVLATHYPDRFKAVISASGWFRREYYGDANPIFNHDVQLDFQDGKTKAVLEASIAEHDCAQSAANLRGMDVYIRHGSADRTVPVWMGRRYSRVLAQHGIDPHYEELAGKDHWWWDTSVANDGGVMFDSTLRNAIEQAFATPDIQSGANRVTNFKVVSLNPATFGPKFGLQILDLGTPGRRASLDVERIAECSFRIDSANVNVFQLVKSRASILHGCTNKLHLDVDGAGLDLEDTAVIARTEVSAQWQLESLLQDKYLSAAQSSGPMRQAFVAKACVVIDVLNPFMLSLAVYLANGHAIASATPIDIMDVNDDTGSCVNFIIFDINGTHPWLMKNPTRLGLTYARNSVKFAGSDFQHGVASVFNAPTKELLGSSKQADDRATISIVATGVDAASLSMVVRQSFATQQALTRALYTNMLPDYMLVGKDFGGVGFGDADVGFQSPR
eukprot:TRINITY_DN11710_c0_g1_i5.p1 TRINITY_DN11710_c0_g1~~TRINITY_DN11710_c0_g1_i5.p1  ORF type:complete len:877 (+),score=197.04 TRINITY_DN11710_c0_g1_i5:98-2728(+)